MPACSSCQRHASFYKRENEGTSLCKTCFRDSVERRVRRTISHWKMFSPTDHVAVAVSGGKDSLTLLMILKKLSSRFSQTKITAVTIDEGIAGYREEAVDLASEYCKKLSVDHEIVSFAELYGNGLDDFLRGRKDRLTACSYCGVQTYLLNLFQGDVERFERFSPVLRDPRGGFLPRVKPLCEVPEREVALYGYVEGLTFQSASCPYMMEALRNELRTVLNRLELAHPGVVFSAYRAMTRLRGLAEPNVAPSELYACRSCGEPTTQGLCEACRMVGVTADKLDIPA